MTQFVFPAPAPTTLAVAGNTAVFPVGRVYCIGRNYRWSPDEPPPQAMPAWFMKPANAVVPAQGMLPYPPATRDLCHEIELVVAMLSRSVTLLPGDLIYTGTPAGVGPLHTGDLVQGGVAGIGQFSMTVGGAPRLATASLQPA